MNWQATTGRPYGLCFDYNFILTEKNHISTTTKGRQKVTAIPPLIIKSAKAQKNVYCVFFIHCENRKTKE